MLENHEWRTEKCQNTVAGWLIHVKKYIRSMPQSMIKRFTLGDTKAEFSHVALLKAAYSSALGSGSLEAARVTANKVLEISGKPFLLKISPFPMRL